jgi:hypothetical protein
MRGIVAHLYESVIARAPVASTIVSPVSGVRIGEIVPYHSMLPAALDTESERNIPLTTALDENVPNVQASELLAEAEPAGVAAAPKPIVCRV